MAIELLYLSSCMVNVSDPHVCLCRFFVSSSACHVTGLQWSNRGLARSRSFVLSSRLGTWGLQNGYMLHETDILSIVRSRIVWSIEHCVSGLLCRFYTKSFHRNRYHYCWTTTFSTFQLVEFMWYWILARNFLNKKTWDCLHEAAGMHVFDFDDQHGTIKGLKCRKLNTTVDEAAWCIKPCKENM